MNLNYKNNFLPLYRSRLTKNKIIKNSNLRLFLFYLFLNEIIKPKYAFEIGAYDAEFSINLRKKLKDTEIYAFEASKDNFDHFTRARNFHNKNINYINLALSDKTGHIDFYMQDKNLETNEMYTKIIPNNSLHKRNEENIEYQQVSIPSDTLNNFVKNEKINNVTNSMWIDVEGSNKEVLNGASEVLKNSQLIYIEVEDKKFWENQWLSDDVIEFLNTYNLIPIGKDFEDFLGQYNLIFIKKELLQQYNTGLRNKILLNVASLGYSRLNKFTLKLFT